MIQAGTYIAHATQWELGLTKEGREQICVQFEILEGDYAGYTLNWFGYFTDKTTERTIQSLRYCGWKGDDLQNLDADGMGTLQVQIVVEMEEATEGKSAGKTFPKVRWVNRLGGGGPIKLERPMDTNQKRMFAARMKLHAKAVPVMTGGYPVSDRAKTETPRDPDDPPF